MFDCTLGVIDKIRADMKRFAQVADIVVQVIFLAFYTYSIVVNGHNVFRLVVYSLLLAFSFGYFVFHVITLKNESKHFKKVIKKNVKRILKYCKLAVQGCSLGFTVYELISFGSSDLRIIVTVCTAVAFVTQIMIQIFNYIGDKYFALLKAAFDEDMEPIRNKIEMFSNPKAAFVAALDKPIKYWANKKMKTDKEEEEEPLNKKEAKMQAALNDIKESYKQKVDEKKQRKAKEKDDVKKQIAASAIKDLKDHWGVVVRRQKKTADNEEQ